MQKQNQIQLGTVEGQWNITGILFSRKKPSLMLVIYAREVDQTRLSRAERPSWDLGHLATVYILTFKKIIIAYIVLKAKPKRTAIPAEFQNFESKTL
jgi:hypothetical protein